MKNEELKGKDLKKIDKILDQLIEQSKKLQENLILTQELKENLRSKPELKPCPFCGLDDIYYSHNRMICDGCNCQGPESYNEKKAIDNWNYRVNRGEL